MWDLIKYKNNRALVDDSGLTITYEMLYEETMKMSKVINTRCTVLVLCSNKIGSIVGYVGFLNNKIVPIMINSNMQNELVQNLIDMYYPSYLWVPDELDINYTNCIAVYSCYGYKLLQMNYSKEYELNNQLCILMATSGSTGSPKFVRQSYNNILENAKSIVEYLGLDETEKPITTLPMNYCYGLSIINSHLLVGATILVTDKGILQREFWDFFKKEEATSFGGVPYTYEMLNKVRFYNMNLPSLRYCTQAGGKLTSNLHRKFAEYAACSQIKFIVMYGQCEATARMGYLPADKALEKCGSMGIAIPGGKFFLIDADGNEINKPDVTGELVYEGPNVTMGYAECADDLINDDDRKGILYTGDMAQIDKEGFYYIVGRKKRFLKIYGNRVNLDAVDQLIKMRFNNIECVCSGIDDHMYIFLLDSTIAEEVRAYVTITTKLNPKAFSVNVIDEIPKTDAGKILYGELSKYYKN